MLLCFLLCSCFRIDRITCSRYFIYAFIAFCHDVYSCDLILQHHDLCHLTRFLMVGKFSTKQSSYHPYIVDIYGIKDTIVSRYFGSVLWLLEQQGHL